jgi:DNA ligase (NAD+)
MHFFKTLGTADGFGTSCIATLYQHNYRNIFTIYQLTKSDFEAIGMGPKISANLEKNLLLSRQRSVEDWRFLAAFGIRHLATGKSERILQHHNLEDIFTLTADDIIKIEGFAQTSADIIISGLKRAQDDFLSVFGLGFQITRTRKVTELNQTADSPIKGKLIVFTGTMKSGSRSKLEKKAKSLGAKVGKSVTSRTDYLVTGDKVGMNKINSAKDKGVTVLPENEYLAMIPKE